MNWEMIIGCIWLVALLYCAYEAYYTPNSSPEDTNGYPEDNDNNHIFINKVDKKANGSDSEKQYKKGFYNGKTDNWIKNK
jgi:hypothetical protein